VEDLKAKVAESVEFINQKTKNCYYIRNRIRKAGRKY